MVDTIELNKNRMKYFLLDVRTREEFEDGHIRDSINIPISEIASAERKGIIPKDKKVVCICRSGDRSSKATRYLASIGYNVGSLNGGITDWVNDGFEIKRG